jgi:WD40 repeat protein
MISLKWLRTLKGHSMRVSSVAISSDSLTVVSGSDDGSIKVWGW